MENLEFCQPLTAPDAGSILTLAARAWEDAALYLQLSRQLAGPNRELLRQLFREERANAACLRGICALITGERPTLRAPAPKTERPELVLRRCYGREMQRLVDYESRSGQREYGPAFARLANREQQHCRMLLEILGSLPTGA